MSAPIACDRPDRVPAPFRLSTRQPIRPGRELPSTASEDPCPTAGNPPGTPPLHDPNHDCRPFLPSSLALGIRSHRRHGKQPSYRSPQPAHRGLNLCAMTSPRSTYGGGYYSASFPDTPIYDSLVAERGTPQIAPIRVPAAYDTGGNLPALPSALPALPAAPSPYTYGYPQAQQLLPRCSRRRPRTSRRRPTRRADTPARRCSSRARLRARATTRCAPPLPGRSPRPSTRTRTTTSSTAATEPTRGQSLPPGRMRPWGMRNCCRFTFIRSKRSGVSRPGRPWWSPGVWPETDAGR